MSFEWLGYPDPLPSKADSEDLRGTLASQFGHVASTYAPRIKSILIPQETVLQANDTGLAKYEDASGHHELWGAKSGSPLLVLTDSRLLVVSVLGWWGYPLSKLGDPPPAQRGRVRVQTDGGESWRFSFVQWLIKPSRVSGFRDKLAHQIQVAKAAV